MRLNTEDLNQLAACAVAAVEAAGRVITQYDRRELTVQHKAGGESLASQVVTEVDMLSQAVILRYLLPTCTTYDIALLSEEQLDDGSRFQKDAFWCIDPLDGTLPFTEGIPGYAVSIALVDQAGTPWIGVVYDPTTQTRYQAIRGQGVWRNGAPWQWHEPESSALQFICDRSVQRLPQFNSLIECLESLAGELEMTQLETTFTGGAVMNAMWVLERAPACYFKQSKSQGGGGCLWDYAATACIYTELGAWCSDFEGHVLDLNRADSHFMNHRGILFASNAIMAERLLAIFCTEHG